MSKDNHLELKGTVQDSAKGIFRVLIDNTDNHIVLARISGKMRLHKINVVVADRVIVKVSPYDMTNGMISQRLKEDKHNNEKD